MSNKVPEQLPPGWNQLVLDAQELERRLHLAGLHVTARKQNEVVRAIGWELTGDTKRADKPDPSGPRG